MISSLQIRGGLLMQKLVAVLAFLSVFMSACGNSEGANSGSNDPGWYFHYEGPTGGLDYYTQAAPNFIFGNPSVVVLHDPKATEGTNWERISDRPIANTVSLEFVDAAMFVVGNNPSDNTADIGDFEWAITTTNQFGAKEVVYSHELPERLWRGESDENNVLVITGAKVFWVVVSNDRTEEFQIPYRAYEEYYIRVSDPNSLRIDHIQDTDWGLCVRDGFHSGAWGPCGA